MLLNLEHHLTQFSVIYTQSTSRCRFQWDKNMNNHFSFIVNRLIITLLLVGSYNAMCENQQKTKLALFAGSIAGSGNIDGFGKTARFTFPNAITIAPSGDLFVTEGGNANSPADNNHTIRKITASGEVTTFAGTAGLSGSNDGKTTSARFNQPSGIASDDKGNLFVADTGNNVIRKISPKGTVSTFAGMAGLGGSKDGTGSDARFDSPKAIAIDSKNNLYVADWINHTIRKITADGKVSTFAGKVGSYDQLDGEGAVARFKYPSGIAIDGADNLYVSEYDVIRKISPDGAVTTLSHLITLNNENEKIPARLDGISGITIDLNNNLFITEQSTVIRKINPEGIVSTLSGSDLGLHKSIGSDDGVGVKAKFDHPTGLVADAENNIWVCDTDNHTIRKISPAGNVITVAGEAVNGYDGDGIGVAARFSDPNKITADSQGNIYVDVRFGHIRKITPEAVVTTLNEQSWQYAHKAKDSYAWSRSFTGIAGLASDDKDNVYVSSSLPRQHSGGGGYSMLPDFLRKSKFDQLLSISPSASVRTVAGKSSSLNFPAGITIDKQGHLYVAMSEDNTIVKITPRKILSPRINIIAGNAGNKGSADGTKDKARFNYPTDVVMDSKQNLYVTDNRNHTLRKITPAGVVSTFAGKAGEQGSTDGNREQSRFDEPNSITIDSNDNLYVVDSNNQTVRKITPQGIVSTLVGQVRQIGFIKGDLPGVIPHPKSVVVHNTSLYITVSSGIVVVRNLPE